jgi:glutamate dehydrogenase (NADP+)
MKVEQVIDNLKRRFPNEPEYYQAVQEVLESIVDVYMRIPNLKNRIG